jgi:hypothetical protein
MDARSDLTSPSSAAAWVIDLVHTRGSDPCSTVRFPREADDRHRFACRRGGALAARKPHPMPWIRVSWAAQSETYSPRIHSGEALQRDAARRELVALLEGTAPALVTLLVDERPRSQAEAAIRKRGVTVPSSRSSESGRRRRCPRCDSTSREWK